MRRLRLKHRIVLHPNFGDRLGSGQGKKAARICSGVSVRVRRWLSTLQPEGRSTTKSAAFPDREIACLVFKRESFRARAGSEVEHHGGRKGERLGSDSLHQIRGQCLLDNTEACAPAHIRSQRAANSPLHVPGQGKDPAAQRRIAGGTVRHGSSPRSETAYLIVNGVYIVRQHGAPADQAVALVNREIIGGPRKLQRHLFHLSRAFVDVGGEPKSRARFQ